MRFLLLFFALLCLNGCLHLQAHSRDWNEAKSSPQIGKKEWKHPVKVAHKTTSQSKKKTATKEKQPSLPPDPPLVIPPRIIPADGQPDGIRVVSLAEKFLGMPYRYGGETPEEGFDCSGLVQYVFAQEGIKLPRLANEQFEAGTPIEQQALAAGDLVFFRSPEHPVGHVGIYVSDRYFIHAPQTGKVISYANLDTPYYQKNYQGARRVL
mgnify:CR=1 FL=1